MCDLKDNKVKNPDDAFDCLVYAKQNFLKLPEFENKYGSMSLQEKMDKIKSNVSAIYKGKLEKYKILVQCPEIKLEKTYFI